MKKNKKRAKQTGEVFTPEWLINDILSSLSMSSSSCKKKLFIDPACGDGNFLVEIVKRKLKAGSTKWEALSTTFGIDIMPDNVEEARKRVLDTAKTKQKRFKELVKTTIVCGNSLEQSTEELFAEYEKKYGEKIKTA